MLDLSNRRKKIIIINEIYPCRFYAAVIAAAVGSLISFQVRLSSAFLTRLKLQTGKQERHREREKEKNKSSFLCDKYRFFIQPDFVDRLLRAACCYHISRFSLSPYYIAT